MLELIQTNSTPSEEAAVVVVVVIVVLECRDVVDEPLVEAAVDVGHGREGEEGVGVVGTATGPQREREAAERVEVVPVEAGFDDKDVVAYY